MKDDEKQVWYEVYESMVFGGTKTIDIALTKTEAKKTKKKIQKQNPNKLYHIDKWEQLGGETAKFLGRVY